MKTLTVTCGTYDGAVFALEYTIGPFKKEGPEYLKPLLFDPVAHNGCVTSIAVCNPVIVSGGTDEAIQVFSIPEQVRLGSLEVHTGTIRHLEFAPPCGIHAPIHFLSASDDGCIAIFRQQISPPTTKASSPWSWECIRLLRRHKGPVISMSIHPSSRCAYSISEDKTFRIWNLLRGRQAYATRLKLVAPGAIGVTASPGGSRILFHWSDRFDLIDLILNDDSPMEREQWGRCLASVQFPQALPAQPVIYSEDDREPEHPLDEPRWVYVLVGVGQNLKAFRCPCVPGDRQAEEYGDVRLPGKRIKFIRVLEWPHVDGDLDWHGRRCRLVVVVTTESSGSHIRGYAVNLNKPLEASQSLLPVFAHDIDDARITALAADWSGI